MFRKTGDTGGQLLRVDPNKAVTAAPDLKFAWQGQSKNEIDGTNTKREGKWKTRQGAGY